MGFKTDRFAQIEHAFCLIGFKMGNGRTILLIQNYFLIIRLFQVTSKKQRHVYVVLT